MNTTVNKMSWDLDTIFPGGSSSAEFESFRKTIDTDLKAIEELLIAHIMKYNND